MFWFYQKSRFGRFKEGTPLFLDANATLVLDTPLPELEVHQTTFMVILLQ